MAQNGFERHENVPFYMCAFAPESSTQNKKNKKSSEKKEKNIRKKQKKNKVLSRENILELGGRRVE